jgi:hypothetical protein
MGLYLHVVVAKALGGYLRHGAAVLHLGVHAPEYLLVAIEGV